VIYLTTLMTNGGVPYPSYIPSISVWRLTDNTQVVNSALMTSVGGSGLFSYPFSSFSYGVHYVYLVTGDPTISPSDTYKWGSCYQEVPDRVIGLVQSDAGNSTTQFKSDRLEATNNYWNNTLCLFLTGSLTGQVQKVTGYSGSTYILTFSSGYTGTPSAGDTYELMNL
jgi:hypothetical protein